MNDQKDGSIQYQDNLGETYSTPGNVRFDSYKGIFQNLIKQKKIITNEPLVSMIITYDSSRAITVTQQDDWTSYIKMYSLIDHSITFEETIGGGEHQNIKVKEVEQNSSGTYFACCYQDDGKFRLRTFGKTSRTLEQIEDDELKINEQFGLDDYTMPNNDFADPYITCCFISEDEIFVNFFHNYSKTHCHFVWNHKKRHIRGLNTSNPDDQGTDRYQVPISREIDCNLKNFPYKCFYNDEQNEIYSFYRQGHTFTINPQKLDDYRFERITEMDLGQMVFFGNHALITRSSSKILFFKQKFNLVTEKMEWIQYHQLKARGFIYFIKGNIRIQLVTDQLIYFYFIDFETFMPELENVMYNYMGCSQMMFGKRVRYCITYKENQMSFDIYQRKYMHNLRVCVDSKDYSGSQVVDLATQDVFMISDKDKLIMFDSSTFKQVKTVPIPLLPTETREINEIIGLQKSKCENWLAVISGKNLVMNEQKQNQLFIFKRRAQTQQPYDYPEYVLYKRIIVKEIPIFNRVCMQFFFKNTEFLEDDKDSLIFCKADKIFELNFEQRQITILFEFQVPLLAQPSIFVSNTFQDIFMLGSFNDALYVNISNGHTVDLDELYGLSSLITLIYDDQDGYFYFLANKKDGIIGFYLIQIDQLDPNKYKYHTMWRHKLDIGDASINILRGYDEQVGHFKELIVGYKTIYINTYNTVIYDLSGDPSKRETLQRHECFQLWESRVSGLFLSRYKDFLTFSKSGINILTLGAIQSKPLKDSEGQMKMIHSLDSLSYLKVDKLNFINFKCQDYNNRVISIEQEWKSDEGTPQVSTHYTEIYKIKIFEITLRELLILQSFYICVNQSDIVNLVRKQPKPQFFYKTFLELNGANMASILAFDSRSMTCLLCPDNSAYFSEEFPIIYKNKALKKDGSGNFYYTNALVYALNNNQVGAVNVLIRYIVKYQNNFVSSYLLVPIIPRCLDNGIDIAPVLKSQIFYVPFDFDAWPANHNDIEPCIRPYGSSFFHLRFKYREVFPEDKYLAIESQDQSKLDVSKVCKIKYTINLLPQVGKHVDMNGKTNKKNISLMNLFESSDELEIYDQEPLQTLIDYKWETFGLAHHQFGLIMHLFYVFTLCIYVKQAYLQEGGDMPLLWNLLLGSGVLYPAYYNITQLRRLGVGHYLSTPANYVDIIFIQASIANTFFQLVLGPRVLLCKLLMILVVLMCITRTFTFLRIYPTLTPIVVMLKTVIIDLKVFLFFFALLVFFFANSLAVMGLGVDPTIFMNPAEIEQYNFEQEAENAEQNMDDQLLLRRQLAKKGGGGSSNDSGPHEDPFFAIGPYLGVMASTLLSTIGDYENQMESLQHLSVFETYIFWVIWFLLVTITSIIFLNFIIAEASSSYQKVVDTLVSTVGREKCALIQESEEMGSKQFINQVNCPKYLICRSIEQ